MEIIFEVPKTVCRWEEQCRTKTVDYTVNVQKPNVQFGKPNANMFGFRTVRISDVRALTKMQFGTERLKSGLIVWISDVQALFSPQASTYIVHFRNLQYSYVVYVYVSFSFLFHSKHDRFSKFLKFKKNFKSELVQYSYIRTYNLIQL